MLRFGREVIWTLLNTVIPLKCTEYLVLRDSACKDRYVSEFSDIEHRLHEQGLSSRINELNAQLLEELQEPEEFDEKIAYQFQLSASKK